MLEALYDEAGTSGALASMLKHGLIRGTAIPPVRIGTQVESQLKVLQIALGQAGGQGVLKMLYYKRVS